MQLCTICKCANQLINMLNAISVHRTRCQMRSCEKKIPIFWVPSFVRKILRTLSNIIVSCSYHSPSNIQSVPQIKWKEKEPIEWMRCCFATYYMKSKTLVRHILISVDKSMQYTRNIRAVCVCVWMKVLLFLCIHICLASLKSIFVFSLLSIFSLFIVDGGCACAEDSECEWRSSFVLFHLSE